MPQSLADATFGAAYKVLFERLDPNSCTTFEARASKEGIITAIATWARTQPTEISVAYSRALTAMVAEMDKLLENNERSRQMLAIKQDLPKPPSDELLLANYLPKQVVSRRSRALGVDRSGRNKAIPMGNNAI